MKRWERKRLIATVLVCLLSSFAPLGATAESGTAIYAQLQRALAQEDDKTIASLVAQGLDPNVSDREGNPLLVWAARHGKTELVSTLLRHGASVNQRNLIGETALMAAAYGGSTEIAAQLLEAGAIFDHDGWNPLIYAAMQGHSAVVDLLLKAGANPNRASENGMTPLMWAARNGHAAVVARLLAHGADTEAVSDRGYTAVSLALSKGETAIAQQIEAVRRQKGLPPTQLNLSIE
ncbi:ankyrin repeat domain-containing protein [Hydrogenophilus thiooxidans]|uniref:ankyrin repeat domain-containing protein n=1 Tax=Hydrogenophilus thiooxidans TaxID=2820326 RepID=UPI001C22D996|nr:ankyrin repeat domain-containing protein [Hydrogenophilus thiooxidans]